MYNDVQCRGDEDGDGVHSMEISGFLLLPRKTPNEEWGKNSEQVKK